MKVMIDLSLCEGHALCVASAPEVFELGEDERAIVLDVEIAGTVLQSVAAAIACCPVHAISVQQE